MTGRRAVELREFGQDLRMVELPPTDPMPGGIVADVTHAGVCGTDIHLQQGRLPIPLPVVLGHEAVGRVAELGEGFTTDALGQPLRVGDPVSWASNISCEECFRCVQDEEPSLCGDHTAYGINQWSAHWPPLSGGWSEQIYLQPGSTIVRLPEGVEPEEVIALGCAGSTTVHALRHIARPEEGETVVVQGSGLVGIAAAMMATIAGAGRVIMLGGPTSRLRTAQSLGIGDVHLEIFLEEDEEERVCRVLDETPEGRGADLVVEATGVPSAVGEGMAMTRNNGRFLMVGQYTDQGPVMLNPQHVTRKQLRILGSWAFSPAHHVGYVQSVADLKERFDLSALVASYPLEEADRAIADMRLGTVLKPLLRTGAA